MINFHILNIIISIFAILLAFITSFYSTVSFVSNILILLYLFILLSFCIYSYRKANNITAFSIIIFITQLIALRFWLPINLAPFLESEFVYLNPNEVQYGINKYIIIKMVYDSIFLSITKNIKYFNTGSKSLNANTLKIVLFILFLISLGCVIRLILESRGLIELFMQRSMTRTDRIYNTIGSHWKVFAELYLLGVLIAYASNYYKSIRFLPLMFFVGLSFDFIVSGNRSTIIFTLLILLIIYAAKGKSFNMKKTILIGITALLLISIAQYVRTNNKDFRSNNLKSFEIFENITLIINTIQSRGIVRNGSIVVTSSDSTIGGKSYESLLYLPIPSKLLQIVNLNKPYAAGRLNAYLNGGRLDTAWPMTPSVEIYWNFGYIGVVLFAIIHAMLIHIIVRNINWLPKEIAIILFLYLTIYFAPGSDAIYKTFQKIVLIMLFILTYKLVNNLKQKNI